MDTEDSPLPCLFSTLVKTYEHKKLSEYETKEKQRIRNADTNAIKTRIKLFEPHFVELSSFQNKLEKYTICEKHYNQIVPKDNYLNYLNDDSLPYPRKRSRNSNILNLNNMQIESSTDIGIQVELDSIDSNNDLLMQIKILKDSLNTLTTDHSKQAQIIENKNNKIFELEHECEYLKKEIADYNYKLGNLNLYKSQVEALINEKMNYQVKIFI
ncbi:hypothetical protein C2G38_2150302 [Gigaspora rosea]|uniref:Uncharacterized protein n=1 Tax=Gigaspora rosea TaxID=44941 RepID=A0A397TWI6_9GLOM|nr:hypothetical protein C2G38_2150302 [Gigaspora rosea]